MIIFATSTKKRGITLFFTLIVIGQSCAVWFVMKKLFVFDLDFTLWDAGGTWCDCTIPPYRIKDEKVVDTEGAQIKLYPDVIHILKTLKSEGIKVAVASRTNAPKSAKQLMKLLEIEDLVDYAEIYPKQKTHHFKKIAKRSGLQYYQMIFFDDEIRNIKDVEAIGVDCIHVSDGINTELVLKHLHKEPLASG